MIRAVLFDYGGTLVKPRKPFDQVKARAIRASHRILAAHGLELGYGEYLEVDRSVFTKYSALERKEGRDIPDVVKYAEIVDILFPSRSEPWRQRAARKTNDAFWEVAVRNYLIRRNTRRTLTRLRAMKVRLGVVSNHHNHEALLAHLGALGIRSRFSVVVSSDREGVRKPDGRIFLSCLASMKVDPRYAIFVGDSLEKDVGGARSVGMRTVLITDGNDEEPGASEVSEILPDFLITDIAEIPRILLSL